MITPQHKEGKKKKKRLDARKEKKDVISAELQLLL